jgi:hypothetical protein
MEAVECGNEKKKLVMCRIIFERLHFSDHIIFVCVCVCLCLVLSNISDAVYYSRT